MNIIAIIVPRVKSGCYQSQSSTADEYRTSEKNYLHHKPNKIIKHRAITCHNLVGFGERDNILTGKVRGLKPGAADSEPLPLDLLVSTLWQLHTLLGAFTALEAIF
jgi:hypothetical protein